MQALLARTEGLPALSATTLEVLRLCQAEAATLDDLAAVLAGDPALSAALLRFAGSPSFGIGAEVHSLQRAALVLGLKNVQLLSLAHSLLEAVPHKGKLGLFDCELFWRRSLVRAVSARVLAGVAGIPAQDEAFAAGLLGEIGQVVLARALASTYEPVLRAATQRGSGWPGTALEHELLGFDHRDVGAALLGSHALLSTLALTVEHGRDPECVPQNTPAELVRLVRALSVATDVTDLLTLAPHAGALERVHTRARDWFGLDAAQASVLIVALEEPIRATAGLLGLDPPSGSRHAHVLEAARAECQTSATPPPSPR